MGGGVRVCNYAVRFIEYADQLKTNKIPTDLLNMYEKNRQKKDPFTYEDIAKSKKYEKDLKYERDFFPIVKESSSNKDKLKYAVQQVVLKSKEKEFTYEQLTEAILKGDPKLYMEPNVIGKTVKELGYVKKSRTRKGVRKYYYV